MSILDILKGAGGGHKASPDIGLGGGYSKTDVKLAGEMAKRLSAIEKLVKSTDKAWEKMSATRSLLKAKDSLAAFEKQQKVFDKTMKSGTISMRERISQYGKLADARKKAIDDTKEYNKQLNESRGMMGRLQNVLNEMPAGLSLFTAAIRDAGIVLGDMNQGFDIMARTGQIQNKTMGELATSTGKYMAAMRLGSVQAAQFGVVAEDSNAAFAKLTETYGGTGDKVDEMSRKWGGMAAMSKLSGLGMVDIATLADQGYKKLGETLDDTLNTVKDMTEITGELNNRFGEGSVNSKAFASAIQEMAYGASFMNQNSRMLTETLGRELQMQLALGKAPEAALASAKKNMEMAGKVNIVGITQFRDAMQAEWNALKTDDERTAHLEKLKEEFGSEGEIIADLLKRGSLMSSDSLFAFEKAVENSSALSQKMLEDMRASASTGNVGDLLAKGLSIQDAQYMVAEANLLATKIKGLSGDKGNQQAAALFGEKWKEDEDASAMVNAARSGKVSMRDLQKQFYEMGGAGTAAQKALAEEAGAGKKPAWEEWASANQVTAWMGGMLNSVKTIPALLASLPISLGVVIAGLMARKGLGRLLGNIPLPGTSKGAGMVGRLSKSMPTFARGAGAMMGKGAGMLGRGAMTGMKGILGIAGKAGPIGAAITALGGFAYGVYNASEIFGKVDPSMAEYAAAGVGQAISALTFGLIDAKEAAETSLDVGGWMKNLVGLGEDPLAPTKADSEIDQDAVAKHRKMLRERGALPKASNAKSVVTDTPVSGSAAAGDSGAGAARATGSVSGRSLILEVTNWDSIYAQSVNDAA